MSSVILFTRFIKNLEKLLWFNHNVLFFTLSLLLPLLLPFLHTLTLLPLSNSESFLSQTYNLASECSACKMLRREEETEYYGFKTF